MRLEKDPALIVRSQDPFNGGPPLPRLVQHFVTPVPLFFVRNHGSIPSIDPATYRLRVRGLVNTPLELSLQDIRVLPQTTLVAALQCAGNRRSELMALGPIPGEVPWGAEAAGNALWTGVALRDVLTAAGVRESAQHVAFTGLDKVERRGGEGGGEGFGGSIPLQKALGPEVLLATGMNGEPLPPVHGFPVRVIVPGYIGARSVKWLSEITVQEEPSSNYFQAHAYKMFPPQVRAEDADWSRGQMLGELPVNAVICEPADGATVSVEITARGYALTGGGRRIDRVELTVDGGASWQTAGLSPDDQPFAWRLFTHRFRIGPGRYEIAVRAWDSAASTQPEDARRIWNFKGYMNNAWHRVHVDVRE